MPGDIERMQEMQQGADARMGNLGEQLMAAFERAPAARPAAMPVSYASRGAGAGCRRLTCCRSLMITGRLCGRARRKPCGHDDGLYQSQYALGA